MISFIAWVFCALVFVGALAWYQTLSGIPWLATDVTPLAVFGGWLGWHARPRKVKVA